MSNQQHILEVRDLAIGYPGHMVLHNVNFTIDSGEILAIIGQNGCGKSTLLKTLCGILAYKEGEILYNGRRLNGIEPHELTRTGISFLAQGGLIMPSLTVREHLQLAGSHHDRKKKEILIERALSEFRTLSTFQERLAGNLSGGERQMLSLAVLQVQDTRTWLLDEPTTGLAPEMVTMTIDHLRFSNQERGINMLLVEHNMEVAFKLASRVIICMEGTLTKAYFRNQFLNERFIENYIK